MSTTPRRGRKGGATGATDPGDRATTYARDVVAGRLPAGPIVRDACARHLRDLDAGKWTWDIEAASWAIGYFPAVLRLAGGEHEGVKFDLLDWQAFIVGSLFGWKAANGTRRFRMAYVESGKGSGKSPLAAGIGLYMLTADKEPRSEVYAVAGTKDQAQILFRDAVAMVDQSPDLRRRLSQSGGAGKVWNLADIANGAFFRTLASDTPKSGLRPHCALIDELHEHPNDKAVAMMRAGTKGRRSALIFMITNSGADRTGVCFNYHQYAAEVCAGTKVDDAFFAYVCGLDEEDDPFKSEDCWAKANPSLGHTFQHQYLRELVTQARGMPSAEGVVRRLNFCQWTDSATAWIDRDLWEAVQRLEGASLEERDSETDALRGLPCTLGLDLSSKRDLTSLAAVWTHPDGRRTMRNWFWTPGDTVSERERVDRAPYQLWVDQGHLLAPPGRMIDKEYVALFVQAFALKHNVTSLAFDQALMDDFWAACDAVGLETWVDDGKDTGNKVGLRMQRHGQGHAGYLSTTALWMPRSIEGLEAAVVRGEIEIINNPVLTWNSACAVLQSDASGNRKWDKQKSNGRIDGMLAASMALGASLAGPARAAVSIYDDPEMLEVLEADDF